MPTVERSNIGLLNDKLTVKLAKEDYMPGFEKKLKEYSKTANIPGFRKGHVPAGMIKKMYGPSIFNDEVLRTIEQALFGYLEKERPDIFAQPLPAEEQDQKLDMNNPGDFAYAFEIGLKPVYELPSLATASLTRNVVDVTDEMVNEELDRMRLKAGKMQNKETVEGDDDVLNMFFTETDENGMETENGIVKDIPVAIKSFSDDMRMQLKGKRAGDSFTFQPGQAFAGEGLNTILRELGLQKESGDEKKYFAAGIKSIGELTKRELNEEFFGEVYPGKKIADETGMRNALKADLEKYWESQGRNQLHDQIYHLLLDETRMEFPQAFLTRWLRNGGDKPRTQEEAEAEYAGFQNQLKWTLISDNIIRENKLDVSEEELRESMRAEINSYFGQMNLDGDTSWLDAYIDRMMKDEKQTDATYRRLVTEKLFDWAEKQSNPAVKKVSADEMKGMQHNHAH